MTAKLQREADFQAQVVELARILHWRVAAFRPAMTKHGWRTAVSADGAGYPDLTLVRDRVIFAELKTDKGKVAPEQTAWLAALDDAGAETYVWRPADWQAIVDTLDTKKRK